MREAYKSQEIYSSMYLGNRNFPRMEVETEFLLQENSDRRNKLLQLFLTFRDDDEIVRITRIVSYCELLLYELVKFIEVDIGEKLGGKISDGKTFEIEER